MVSVTWEASFVAVMVDSTESTTGPLAPAALVVPTAPQTIPVVENSTNQVNGDPGRF